LKDWKGRRDQG